MKRHHNLKPFKIVSWIILCIWTILAQVLVGFRYIQLRPSLLVFTEVYVPILLLQCILVAQFLRLAVKVRHLIYSGLCYIWLLLLALLSLISAALTVWNFFRLG